MPTLNWADVVEVSHDEAKQSLLDQLDAVGFSATSWQEGEPALAMVELSAEVWHQLSKVAVFLKEAALNTTATGEALTKLSASHYDNTREGAIAAQRRATLSCAATAGPHAGLDVGDIVIEHPDGPTYRNIDDGVTVYPITIPSGGSVSDLIFEAEVAGTAANKPDQTVTSLQTTLAGVTVSEVAERDGSDAETDALLRDRNTTKWALLTEYELIDDAVKNICLTAANSVTDVVVDSQNPRGAGTFDVYMAGELGTASAGDIALAQAAIDARVFGSTATPPTCVVDGAPEEPLDITGIIYFKGSYEDAALQTAAILALEEFIKTIPLGGSDFYPGPTSVVLKNTVETVLESFQVSGQSFDKTAVLSVPSTDLSVPAFAKVVLGTVSLTFTPAV